MADRYGLLRIFGFGEALGNVNNAQPDTVSFKLSDNYRVIPHAGISRKR